MSYISVQNVFFKYPHSNKNVLEDVSFVIEKGTYTAIVGLNGSGKSTLARLISGLETPDSGKIIVQDKVKIGLVFQSPKEQIISSVVHRDTAFGPQSYGLNKNEVELRTIECLNIVDMLEYAETSSSALSLGQTQKIALSGVLAIWPEVLILDEAVSFLDPESREEIYKFLRYWHKMGNTIIHITHDIDAVKEVDNVIGLKQGAVYYYGPKDAFLQDRNFYSEISPKQFSKKTVKFKDNETVLKVENVSFKYRKKQTIDDISFSINKGTLVALTGKSGEGKSTILELISGLLECESGTIYSLSKPSLVQQNSSDALFEKFAVDDVAFGLQNKGVSGSELLEKVKNAMNIANLPYEEFRDRQTFFLSGGEQRRLSIAGILALDSDIVLFDEPTAGLDTESVYKIMKLMKELTEQGKTVIFTTHKKEEAEAADSEIRIEKGKIVLDTVASDCDENNLPELEVTSSINLLNKLRESSFFLSGAERESGIKKLHPVLRIISFVIIFIFSLAVRPVWACLLMVAVSATYCVLANFSLKKYLSACIKIMPFLLFFSVFQMIFHPAIDGEFMFTTWKWFMITPSKLLFCFATMLRTLASIGAISAFFVSTPEYDLIDGLRVLLSPLNLIKIPVRYFLVIVEIIFRFIPLLIEESSSIIKTQIIRGGLGKASGKIGKIKAVLPLIVPLIIQTIRKSEALADSMTARGFK